MSAPPRPPLPRERLAIDARKVVHETMDGEVILIDLETGDYYSLRGAGADVWAILEHGAEPDVIASAVEALYRGAAAPEAIRAGVYEVLGELYEGDLIRSAAGNSAGPLPAVETPDRPYQAPTLERYTDMQEYLLVDPIHEVDERGWPARKAASG